MYVFDMNRVGDEVVGKRFEESGLLPHSRSNLIFNLNFLFSSKLIQSNYLFPFSYVRSTHIPVTFVFKKGNFPCCNLNLSLHSFPPHTTKKMIV